jgi:hypothetical protein
MITYCCSCVHQMDYQARFLRSRMGQQILMIGTVPGALMTIGGTLVSQIQSSIAVKSTEAILIAGSKASISIYFFREVDKAMLIVC